MAKIRIGIVGAGPGGLASAMLLARRGFEVTVYEKAGGVGGRNAPLKLGPYTFDTGPTFLMMKSILDEVFAEAGRRSEDLLRFAPLDPLYRLRFGSREFLPSRDPAATRARIRELSPDDAAGFDRFLEKEGARYQRLYPCLQKEYGSLFHYLRPSVLRALPYMSLGRSVHGNLGRYFADEDVKISFSFQSKYLGMSPWNCPAFFTMLAYIEHAFGIYHVMGGLNRISEAMSRVVADLGGTIRLSTPVESLLLDGRRAKGVRLAGGEEVPHDEVILNADFGYAMNRLVPGGVLRKYAPARLEDWKLSCSTFMLYLGVKKSWPGIPHHNILFAGDYRKNVEEIADRQVVPEDPSIYVQNASVVDPSLAPPGHSTLYVLVPVPNLRSGTDWEAVRKGYTEKVLDLVERRGGFDGLRENLEEMKVVTPREWEGDYHVYRGATFNLAHTFFQVLYFRPHNRFEELDNCWLVGGGTHPGSGLPTIYESARISSGLICRKHGVPWAVS